MLEDGVHTQWSAEFPLLSDPGASHGPGELRVPIPWECGAVCVLPGCP